MIMPYINIDGLPLNIKESNTDLFIEIMKEKIINQMPKIFAKVIHTIKEREIDYTEALCNQSDFSVSVLKDRVNLSYKNSYFSYNILDVMIYENQKYEKSLESCRIYVYLIWYDKHYQTTAISIFLGDGIFSFGKNQIQFSISKSHNIEGFNRKKKALEKVINELDHHLKYNLTKYYLEEQSKNLKG